MKLGSGSAYQSSAVRATVMPTKAAIHGLRRPLRSAMAPSTGLSTATPNPERPMAYPQAALPAVSSP